MTAAKVVAVGAISALGRGEAAFAVAPVGEVATPAIADDAELAAAGLLRPRAARCDIAATGDRATVLLLDAAEQLMASLDDTWPAWRDLRVGLCVGTSSGGMRSAEQLFASRFGETEPDPATQRAATYFAPFEALLDTLSGLRITRRTQLVAACASSTITMGLGARWLARGACDVVIAGGYDALGPFVASGFDALRATSAGLPRPFRIDRDGMLLGEGAALVALTRHEAPAPWIWVTGFGASSDAVHITAPDREAGGLKRAGAAALAEAGIAPEAVALVSAHATATPYNDVAEARAIAALAPRAVVHPFKAQIGHTLGAAGALEALAACGALRAAIAPASCGDGPLDPEAAVKLLARSAPLACAEVALKLSAAFGGITSALVMSTKAPEPRAEHPPKEVQIVGWAEAPEAIDRGALARATGIKRERLARIDELGQLTVAAAAALVERVGREALTGAGIVSGHALATLDTNERFNRRRLAKGPRWVDPRLFPATSPNAGIGHVGIAYGLVGPSFSVNGSLNGGQEALLVAGELIAAGDAARMVVIAADDAGPAGRDWMARMTPRRPVARGAVALLLAAKGEFGAHVEGVPLALAPESNEDPHDVDPGAGAVGHRALVSWLLARWPRRRRRPTLL